VLAELSLSGKRIGLEYWTAGLSHGLAVALQTQADARWSDVSGLVDRMRRVKSAEEQALMRQAAQVTDAAAGAAIAAISDGASEQEVAAQCVAAMIRAGGHAPSNCPAAFRAITRRSAGSFASAISATKTPRWRR
jgi:Xaa-Pro dipeptidase